MAYYDIYRDQLASLYHGHAPWLPDPAGLYDRVRVGDVGYMRRGHFLRLFNALLPADDITQVYGVPDGFVPLNMGPFHNIRTLNLPGGNYLSNGTVEDLEPREELEAGGPAYDEYTTVSSFTCRSSPGAFLSLPFSGISEDAIRTKGFDTYIRKHCDSWLEFATINDFDVQLEDIVLVTGCDLTSSWAMAAFIDSSETEISLGVHPASVGSARFQWSFTNQPHNNERSQNVEGSHCVFLRGFRAKRISPFFVMLKAAAEPGPDDPDNSPESSIELVQQPAVPEYRDPLVGILDFIAEQCPDQEIAIAHEDDLKLVKGVAFLTADAVESVLRRNNIPVRTEHGAALLAAEDEVVPEDQRVTLFAQAKASGEPILLIVHPVLMEYLLKFDIAHQPPDYDFGLPAEDLLSSAVHPPVPTLVLEHKQGYPQNIEVQTSDRGSETGVTVNDVLKTA
ncbi:hypothetical protein V8E53_010448 [Lactarius tabidus]